MRSKNVTPVELPDYRFGEPTIVPTGASLYVCVLSTDVYSPALLLRLSFACLIAKIIVPGDTQPPTKVF